MKLEKDLLESINAAASRCYKSANDAVTASCSATNGEDTVRTLGNIFTTVFGTTAGATTGVPALAGSRPTTAQGWVSLGSGVLALGLGVFTQVAADPKRNDGLHADADKAWDKYGDLRASASELSAARVDHYGAVQIRDSLKNAGANTEEEKKKLEEAGKDVETALKRVLGAYKKVQLSAEACVGPSDVDVMRAMGQLRSLEPTMLR